MRLILPFCFLIFLGGTTKVTDSSIFFDIVHRDKVVGSLIASQKTIGSKIDYQSVAKIETRLIKGIEVDYKYDVTFENQLLKKADVHITINDKPHAETSTVWKDDTYQIIESDGKKKTLQHAIDYTTILLYFKEPTRVSECYSEQDGSLNSISALGNHPYKKINSKGNENTYHYENGVLKKANIDGGIIHFELIARK